MDKHKFLISTASYAKFGPIRLNLLKKYFKNNWEDVWKANSEQLKQAGVDENIINGFILHKQVVNPDKLLEQINKENISLCTIDDDEYPSLLRQIVNPPTFLYYRGNIKAATDLSVAIVGSRKCSLYGRQVTEKLVTDLSMTGLTIISGLALGVDTYAHESTLKCKGKTVAVLGSGLDWASLYPSANKRLAENIITEGGSIVSEFPLGTQPLPYNFPQRNRIVSGMTRATIVVEANIKSGALITADYALEQNREVMAIPGNIFSPQSTGPNNLIKKGAIVVTNANDVLEALNLEEINHIHASRKILPESPEEKALIDAMSTEPIHINDIVRLTRLDTSVINSTLILMEMKGLIKNLGGMKYVIS